MNFKREREGGGRRRGGRRERRGGQGRRGHEESQFRKLDHGAGRWLPVKGKRHNCEDLSSSPAST